MQIQQASVRDLGALVPLALALWPEHDAHALAEELRAQMEQKDTLFLLACVQGAPCGFAQCGLRHDYVEGTRSTPVGYLEGIYLVPGARGQGLARLLLTECERWALAHGCSEFASDCELLNVHSLSFHLRAGFREANRIICFVKPLKEPKEEC